jgi:hypothetical protein
VEGDLEGLAVPILSSAQAFPLAFTLALGLQPVAAIVLATATLLTTQRAQILGLALGAMLVYAGLKKAGAGPDGSKVRSKKGLVVVGAVVVVTAAGVAIYLDKVLGIIMLKAERIGGEDISLLTRLGHIDGYLDLVSANPLGVIWGYGPFVDLINSFTGDTITMTEMVVLIYLLWYGWIYTIGFYGWISLRGWQLARASAALLDWNLVAACIVLVLIGNVNPVMLTPIAFVLLAMIRARRLELEDAARPAPEGLPAQVAPA